MENIEDKIEKERQHTRTVCSIKGNSSNDCAAAWDTIEELQAEASHRRRRRPINNLEAYST